jgi:hypothetical protein
VAKTMTRRPDGAGRSGWAGGGGGDMVSVR